MAPGTLHPLYVTPCESRTAIQVDRHATMLSASRPVTRCTPRVVSRRYMETTQSSAKIPGKQHDAVLWMQTPAT